MRITFGSDGARLQDLVCECEQWLWDVGAASRPVTSPAAEKPTVSVGDGSKSPVPPAALATPSSPATSAARQTEIYSDDELKAKVNEFSAVIGMPVVRLVMQAHGAVRLGGIKDRGSFLESCYLMQQWCDQNRGKVASLDQIKGLCGL